MNADKQRKADRHAARLNVRRASAVDRQVAAARERCEAEYVEHMRQRFGKGDPTPLSKLTMRVLGLSGIASPAPEEEAA